MHVCLSESMCVCDPVRSCTVALMKVAAVRRKATGGNTSWHCQVQLLYPYFHLLRHPPFTRLQAPLPSLFLLTTLLLVVIFLRPVTLTPHPHFYFFLPTPPPRSTLDILLVSSAVCTSSVRGQLTLKRADTGKREIKSLAYADKHTKCACSMHTKKAQMHKNSPAEILKLTPDRR